MLFIIFIAVLVLGIVLLTTDYEIMGTVLLYFGVIATFFSIITIGCMYDKSDLTDLQTEYLRLNYIKEYATEHQIDINVTTDLLEDIQEYNDKVILRQNYHDNFCIGIYIPDRYDELETIDYDVMMQIN